VAETMIKAKISLKKQGMRYVGQAFQPAFRGRLVKNGRLESLSHK
jgi:hypothetical protein